MLEFLNLLKWATKEVLNEYLDEGAIKTKKLWPLAAPLQALVVLSRQAIRCPSFRLGRAASGTCRPGTACLFKVCSSSRQFGLRRLDRSARVDALEA